MKDTAGTAYARSLGVLAFATGLPCVPGQDKAFGQMTRGRQIGDPRSVPEMRAWIAGWTQANLATT